MSPAASSLLVTRQLAALRRHRWSTLDAISFLQAALPQGELRTRCERATQALRAGGAAPASSDPLERLIASGEAASPETFDCLAEALEAREQAQGALASATTMARLLVAGPLVIAALFGWVVVPSLDSLGWPSQSLPPATQLSLSILGFLRLAGAPLAVAAWVLIPRVLGNLGPGSHQFRLAAALLEFAAASGLGPRGFALTGAELKFFSWREGKAGAAAAARDTAAQLLAEARQRVRVFEHYAPIVVLLSGATIFSTLLLPLMLPLFSIGATLQ